MEPNEEKQQVENKDIKKMKMYPEIPESTEEHVLKEPATAYNGQYTYDDYLSWTDDKMREIINGFVYTFAAPFIKHVKVTTFLAIIMGSFIRRRKNKGKYEIFHAPFDVRLSLNGETDDDKINNVVQPQSS